MINFLYFLLGVLVTILIVPFIYIFFIPHWDKESVVDFTYAIVREIEINDCKLMLDLIEAFNK